MMSHATRKGLLAGVLLLAALLVPQAASAASGDWTSNTFRSPTGNLICKWRGGWYERISCGSFASQKVIVMQRNGRPVQGSLITWDRSDSWPVLSYGQWWNYGQAVSCRSLYGGMRCTNAQGWYFTISRDRISVGRYGQEWYAL